jgi:hypothetical protein
MSRYPRTLFKGDERLRLPDAGRVGGGQPRSILFDPATLRYLTIYFIQGHFTLTLHWTKVRFRRTI